MLKVQGGRYPYELPWVERLCSLVKHNRELRERFNIARMNEFRKFIRTQPLWLIKRSIKALEAGRASSQLLIKWQEQNTAPQAPKPARPAKPSAPPDRQLHLLPFWAGVRGFNL